jgi:hypothetical protein
MVQLAHNRHAVHDTWRHRNEHFGRFVLVSFSYIGYPKADPIVSKQREELKLGVQAIILSYTAALVVDEQRCYIIIAKRFHQQINI